MSQKIMCDRQHFIDCVNGDMLLCEDGIVKKLGDTALQAFEAHEKGDTIYLTKNGVIISTICQGVEVLYSP